MKDRLMEGITQDQLKQFSIDKQQCLSREDLSRKGSIDEPIRCLVEVINSNPHYYTTSTCSGRISLIEKPQDNPTVKRGSVFLLNNHKELKFEVFNELVAKFVSKDKCDECLWLKFEPFILHVQCINLDKARALVSYAIQSGCRNSGMTMGKKEKKILVAIRSTSSMEVPLHCGLRFPPLAVDYLKFLVIECNRRLCENLARLDNFTKDLHSHLKASDLPT